MIYRRLFDYPSWRSGSPFEELNRMRRQLDRLFDEKKAPRHGTPAGVFPFINLSENKDNYLIRAELPGVRSDQLDIQVTDKNIAISGERKIEAEKEGARYHRREREAGKFSRIIGLPGDINADNVDAKLENGILTVVIAKAEAAKPKQIAVTS